MELKQLSIRRMGEVIFNPELPADLNDLPVNLIHISEPGFVKYVGFRANLGAKRYPLIQTINKEEVVVGYPYNAGHEEVVEVVDVNGPPELAQAAVDRLIIPRIRELFGRPEMVPVIPEKFDITALSLKPVEPGSLVTEPAAKVVAPAKPRGKPGRKPKAKTIQETDVIQPA